jgi:hypothetical protein
MKRIYIVFAVITFILSCTSKNPKETASNLKYKQDSILIAQTEPPVLLSNTITSNFSSTLAKDTFKISLRGKTLINSNTTFEIITSHGEKIYSLSFDSKKLVSLYETDFSKIDSVIEKCLRKKVSAFFEKKCFKIPAIAKNEDFEPENSVKEIWNDIKSDRTAIGFYYSIGEYEEDLKFIAYSKKMKKTVVYFVWK